MRWRGSIVGVIVLAASAAHAHMRGTSIAEFAVDANGAVDAIVIVQAQEAFEAVGRAGAGLDDAQPDVRALVDDGLETRADDRTCARSFVSATLVEGDGLRLEERFACAPMPRTITVAMPMIARLSRGHRAIARVTLGATSSEAILSATRASITFEVPVEARPAADGKASWRAPVAIAAAVALAVALAVAIVGAWMRRRR